MNRVANYLTLFTSVSTLLCCALPALLVSLGLGVVVAGLANHVPGLIWISEHKSIVFSVSALLLVSNGVWMWLTRNAPCPVDPQLREACLNGRRASRWIYGVSLGFFLIGALFAFREV